MNGTCQRVAAVALLLLGSAASTASFALAPPGKGTLTITGAIGGGQRNVFILRKCAPNANVGQERVSCQKLPFTLRVNEPMLVDAGTYSVHGPQAASTGSQLLSISVSDGQDVKIPLRSVDIPKVEGVRFRMFLDLTKTYEFHKMALGIWSSAPNAAFLQKSCNQKDPFSQYVCGTWQTPDTLNGAMFQFDTAANFYFIHPNALREAGGGFRMVNLGRIYVNDRTDTGTTLGLFPGVYGIEYFYANGASESHLGTTVN